MAYTVNELSDLLDFSFAGDPDLELTHACGLSNLSPGGVAFITGPDGLSSVPLPDGVGTKKAAGADMEIDAAKIALVVEHDTDLPGYTLIFAEDPLVLHVKIVNLLHPLFKPEEGVHSSAVIGKKVSMGEGVSVGPCAVIHDRVTIGKGTQIHAGTVILSDVAIGEDCLIYPNTVIREKCTIGNRVVLHPNVVIGGDGHGYFQRDGINCKIPQIGRVIIEDDVEIGACSTVDRGRLEDTIIRKGSKLDNQVLIAHNVEVGAHALISGQTAIGGSTKTGHHLILGGQTGIKDNVTIGDNVVVAARGAVLGDEKDGAVLGGSPARELEKWKRSLVYINGLENLFKKVKDLEKKINKDNK